MSDSLRPHESQHAQASLSITNSRSSLRLTSIELVMPSSHLILCHPLFLLPPVPPSIRVFSNESTLRMRWPKYWSFSFSIIPSKEVPGLISFRMDWSETHKWVCPLQAALPGPIPKGLFRSLKDGEAPCGAAPSTPASHFLATWGLQPPPATTPAS